MPSWTNALIGTLQGNFYVDHSTLAACTLAFTDVPPTDPFYSYIHCMACKGIISGYNDGTFRPSNPVTRGQSAKMISNAAGYNEDYTTATFTDAPVGSAFHPYIERLYHRGMINGYTSAGQCPTGVPCFHPDDDVTRGQLSKIVSNAKGYTDTPTGQTFADVPPANPFYVFVGRVNIHGVISGYDCDNVTLNPCSGLVETCPGRYFRPCNNATRAQTAKIVTNTFYPNCQTLTR